MSRIRVGGQRLFCDENGAVFGNVADPSAEQVVPALQRLLASGETAVVSAAETEWKLELYWPRERLYVFGAGPDAEPVVRLAAGLDFEETVVDPRSDRCTEETFPDAQHRVVEHPGAYLERHKLPSGDYVLVMTHWFQHDRAIVERLRANPSHYVGMLGNKVRTARLFQPEPVPEWVQSPVGLSLGAEGPDEIAVSIMAELIRVRSGKVQPR
ncbi:XdhC family protein [Paenibacillus cymbidii]|uniref:XdhC family protein n=1 Tax=Paenibacillus cymbidii TaxID=1639034 RepID=UPI00143687D4|nr:XdhC family protein [Paenibacillus cymbidii]